MKLNANDNQNTHELCCYSSFCFDHDNPQSGFGFEYGHFDKQSGGESRGKKRNRYIGPFQKPTHAISATIL